MNLVPGSQCKALRTIADRVHVCPIMARCQAIRCICAMRVTFSRCTRASSVVCSRSSFNLSWSEGPVFSAINRNHSRKTFEIYTLARIECELSMPISRYLDLAATMIGICLSQSHPRPHRFPSRSSRSSDGLLRFRQMDKKPCVRM
jgi:hypothetical protein